MYPSVAGLTCSCSSGVLPQRLVFDLQHHNKCGQTRFNSRYFGVQESLNAKSKGSRFIAGRGPTSG